MVLRLQTLMIVLSFVLLCSPSDELILVQHIFRHGARYPFYAVPNDKIAAQAAQQNKMAQLTPQGKHMSYILGKLLFKRYWKALFSGTPFERSYHPSLVQAWSTSTNRTIESAQALLIGLLQDLEPETLNNEEKTRSRPPFKDCFEQEISQGQKFYVFGENNKFYHSVSIHTEPVLESAGFKARLLNRINKIHGNFMTINDQANCPNQRKWRADNLRSSEYQKIQQNRQVKRLLVQISRQIGYKVDLSRASEIIDEISVAKHLDVPYLKVFSDHKSLKIAQFIQLSQSLLSFYTLSQRRIVFTEFVETLLNNMKRAIANGVPRLILLSGHDTTLLNVMTAFQLTNLKCLQDRFLKNIDNTKSCISIYPQFSASFTIELWKNKQSLTHYVKMLYNGEQRAIPFCENKNWCSLEELQAWASHFKVSDWLGACGVPQIDLTDE